MTVQEKTQILADAIKETEEFQNLQSAQARVKLDPGAQDLLTQLQQSQGKLMQMQQEGRPIEPDTVKELRDLEAQMQLNLTLKNLVDAQQAFEELMGKVNEILAKTLR